MQLDPAQPVCASPEGTARAQAVTRLFGERAEAAIRLAYYLTRDREAALDLSQEAYVKAMEALGELENPAQAAFWFDRIVVNLCRDWLRRKGAERRALNVKAAEAGRESSDPASHAEHSEARELMRAALLRLPIELREVVVLVNVEGHAPGYAASILGVPAGTLRWRLHEGRKLLREIFEELQGHRGTEP